MLCDNCKKNEATVHIKEVHNGKCVAYNLCSQCAGEKEQKGELGAWGFNLAEVLFNVGKLTESLKKAAPDFETEPHREEVCPDCGWTTEKLRSSGGRLGCPECYHTFEAIVSGALGRVQRGGVHLGKRPGPAASNEPVRCRLELQRLQNELAELVRREEYEAAAVCRDRIVELKQRIGEGEK